MNFNADHINVAMNTFFYQEIQCSLCRGLGLTKAVLYDIPQYLVLSRKSADVQCVNLIDDVDLLIIKPSMQDVRFEYSANIVLMVLDNNEIFYLRKTQNGFSYYNKVNGQFQILTDITAQYTQISSSWMIFIYETQVDLFTMLEMNRTSIDQQKLELFNQPEVSSIDTVEGLLPSFKSQFDVGNIRMEQKDIRLLLNNNGDLNDLIIDGYLSILASIAPTNNRVLAVESYLVSQIIEKRFKQFDKTWLNFDIILCPVNQEHHWYLVIIDSKDKIILELDSMPNLTLPRRRNINRIMKYFDIQHYFHNDENIDFISDWKLAIPTEDFNLKQQDDHSCGVHLLVYAHAYAKQQKFPEITSRNLRLFRYQLAENILKQAVPISTDTDSTVRNNFIIVTKATLLFLQNDGLIEPTPKTLRQMAKKNIHISS
jgi:hypothetical protein